MIYIRTEKRSLDTPFYLIVNNNINKVVYLIDRNTFNAGLYDISTKKKIYDLTVGMIKFRVEMMKNNCNYFKL